MDEEDDGATPTDGVNDEDCTDPAVVIGALEWATSGAEVVVVTAAAAAAAAAGAAADGAATGAGAAAGADVFAAVVAVVINGA